MRKRVYISADYDESYGDRRVVETLHRWAEDNRRLVEFVDTAQVKSGSVSDDSDCRPCDLKQEFNQQINASSAVIIVVGDKTASRTAGSNCSRTTTNVQKDCSCTPYKQNRNGSTVCKVATVYPTGENDDVGCINSYPYIRHEFEQARRKNKDIIVLYNSSRKETNWLPTYMKDYESNAQPFWKINMYGEKEGDYAYIKRVLGYE